MVPICRVNETLSQVPEDVRPYLRALRRRILELEQTDAPQRLAENVFPDYRGLAIFLGCVALLVAVAYVATNWKAVGTKVEVCAGGVREIRRDGTTELPWDQILKVEVGKVVLNHKLRWNVVIRAAEVEDIELLYDFWDAVGGASRFASTVRKFVEDVEFT